MEKQINAKRAERQVERLDLVVAFTHLTEWVRQSINPRRKLQVQLLKSEFYRRRLKVERLLGRDRPDEAEAQYWMARQLATDIAEGVDTTFDKFGKFKADNDDE